MNYYVFNENNEIALLDTDRERLSNTLKLYPKNLSPDSEILSTNREIVSVDSKLVFADEHEEEVLTKAKTTKLNELKGLVKKYTVNDCDEMYIISSLGYAINADKTAQDNIRGLIEGHDESDLIKYKLYDNTFKEDVTIADLKVLLKECAQNGENLYTQKFKYIAQINACTSVEEVNAIDLVFEMMDFTKVNNEY